MRQPYPVPWICVIDKFDIKSANEEDIQLLTTCFKTCHVMVFKNQSERNVSSKDFFEFVKKFDPDVNIEEIEDGAVLHPFDKEPDAPHVAARSNEIIAPQFRFSPLWHMDNVGTKRCERPNYVSAFHFLQVPDVGSETIFCSMDKAYDSLPPDLKEKVNGLKCLYDNDIVSRSSVEMSSEGFRRLGPFPAEGKEDQVIQPLVRRDGTEGRKRMFITPQRFNSFVGWSLEDSWDFMLYIFHTFINTPHNTVTIKWEKGDVAVFNNHALIHTSTPAEIYNGQTRRFRLMFLNTKRTLTK